MNGNFNLNLKNLSGADAGEGKRATGVRRNKETDNSAAVSFFNVLFPGKINNSVKQGAEKIHEEAEITEEEMFSIVNGGSGISFSQENNDNNEMNFELFYGEISPFISSDGKNEDPGKILRAAGNIRKLPVHFSSRECGNAEENVEMKMPGRFANFQKGDNDKRVSEGVSRKHTLSSKIPDITASSTMEMRDSGFKGMKPVVELESNVDEKLAEKISSVIKSRLDITSSKNSIFDVRIALRPESLGRVILSVRYFSNENSISVNVEGSSDAIKAIEKHERAINTGVRSMCSDFSGLEYSHIDEREKHERQKERDNRKKREERWKIQNDRNVINKKGKED
ncbi:MAG: hypothetical protein R6W70_01915 [bacterium]